jgi:hypothetical protein
LILLEFLAYTQYDDGINSSFCVCKSLLLPECKKDVRTVVGSARVQGLTHHVVGHSPRCTVSYFCFLYVEGKVEGKGNVQVKL